MDQPGIPGHPSSSRTDIGNRATPVVLTLCVRCPHTRERSSSIACQSRRRVTHQHRGTTHRKTRVSSKPTRAMSRAEGAEPHPLRGLSEALAAEPLSTSSQHESLRAFSVRLTKSSPSLLAIGLRLQVGPKIQNVPLFFPARQSTLLPVCPFQHPC
jgi:hypothetical protein